MNKFNDYHKLPTEQNNPRTRYLDRLPLRTILEKLNREDALAHKAVSKAIPQIERASRLVSRVYLNGGKVFFIGAGTSGRLGVLEAAELPPTYGVPPSRFRALMAGGRMAVFLSKEGAEDAAEKGRREITVLAKRTDVIIGITASGVTPYVTGGLKAAKAKGAATVILTCNPHISVTAADIVIVINAGPEPISGSTRAKSGTAVKMALNMLTTSAMILSGKVYNNWMVDIKPASRKLELRAERITAQAGRINPREARRLLTLTGNDVKAAIVMARLGVDLKGARALLKKHRGFLRTIIDR